MFGGAPVAGIEVDFEVCVSSSLPSPEIFNVFFTVDVGRFDSSLFFSRSLSTCELKLSSSSLLDLSLLPSAPSITFLMAVTLPPSTKVAAIPPTIPGDRPS